MSTSPNDSTAGLLAARASGIRVVTADGRGIPVAHEPRHPNDREPWAEYEGCTGTIVSRHSGDACTTVLSPRWMQWSASRSVNVRLTRAGVHCVYEGLADGTRARTTFIDGSELTWTGVGIHADAQGDEFTIHHPISEHRILRVQWSNESGDVTEQRTHRFASGSYADDSAALVACVIAYADCHGRTPHTEEQPQIDPQGDPVSATLLKARSQEKGAVRIVTNDDRAVPVAYEPRTSDDPTPWAEYDPADGTIADRHQSLACATLDVERGTVSEPWTVARSIYTRLTDADIEWACGRDPAGTYDKVVFVDGSELTWNGVTVHGDDVSVLHTIGEHRSLSLDFSGRDGREVNHQFATGSYAADSSALVAWVTAYADHYGRAPRPQL
ncbi:hypothetical protein [Streptomyces sp. NPDC058595]|uniref:hypothetical protein n=1 Tax=Streptomyces sp. NPDC058595 TaxID=3346550 RepID=UPI00365F7DAE